MSAAALPADLPPDPPNAARLVALLCLAETLAMTGFGAYPAFLPTLRAEFGFSGTEAGFVGGAFFAGYMLAVPLLAGLTDRIDARRVFAAACLLAACGSAGFGLATSGVTSAATWQALTGAGLAGTYMPGLKALTDRVGGARQARDIAFYTATFGIGTSASLWAAGQLAHVLSWQDSVLVLVLGPLAALPLVWFGLRPHAPAHPHAPSWLPRFGVAFTDATVRRYVSGYAVHCWELFGLRSWLVAFLAYAASRQAGVPPLEATTTAALVNLLGLPASILGNEAAGRWGRGRWISLMMLGSGVLCWCTGLAASGPWWLLVGMLSLYFVVIMGDSAALTAGLVAATPLAQRGAVMAVYSFLGFGAGFLAPLLFGGLLDVAGGGSGAWLLAFGSLGSGCLLWRLLSRPLS